MKVCVATLWKTINSGSYWQAKALELVLRKMGHTVYFYNIKYPATYIKMKYKTILDMIVANGLSEAIKYLRSLREFHALQKALPVIGDDELHTVDCFILGSDTIWNLDKKTLVKNIDVFWGRRFVPHKTITYAGSAANTTVEKLHQYPKAQSAIKTWSAISVRDQNTKELIEPIAVCPVQIVCDPTMLLNKRDYELLCKRKIQGRYIFLYLFKDLSQVQSAEIIRYAKENDLTIIQGVNGLKDRAADYSCVNEPNEFLAHMIGAAYVITDTFHGTIFSINLNKQFISINRNKLKVNDTLTTFEIKDRLVSEDQPILDVLLNEIDYSRRTKTIKKIRETSIQFIINALEESK